MEAKIQSVCGDGAYDTKNCYEALEKMGARAKIPPRRNAKIMQHGNMKGVPQPRDENLRAIRKQGRKQWKNNSGYHQRSLAETRMFRMTGIFGSRMHVDLEVGKT